MPIARPVPHSLAAAALVALLCLLAPAPAAAVVAFTGTGLDFLDDPQSGFPTVAPVVAGTSIDLSALVDSEVLATYPLAAAGTFPGPESLVITYTLGLTRQSDDFDPVFLVSDGTNVVGGQVGDNPNGSARAIEGTLAGAAVTVTGEPLLFQDAGFPPIGGSVEATVEIVLRPGSSDVTVSFLGTEAAFDSAVVLDRNAALSFLLVANSAVTTGEVYRIDSAELEIEVPEPPAGAALLLGAAILAAFRYRAGRGLRRCAHP